MRNVNIATCKRLNENLSQSYFSTYLSQASQRSFIPKLRLIKQIIVLMMQMVKMFPIHSKEEQKGKRKVINNKIKRNTSCVSAQETRSIIQSNKKSANLVHRKQKTAMVTVRNCNTTATNFITSYNVWDHQSNSQRHHQFQMDGSESRRKISYLSRRFIHKKMLEGYLDNVFHKVSLIRASQERPINAFSRGKGRRSLINTTR